jgi:hypothetical protein
MPALFMDGQADWIADTLKANAPGVEHQHDREARLQWCSDCMALARMLLNDSASIDPAGFLRNCGFSEDEIEVWWMIASRSKP